MWSSESILKWVSMQLMHAQSAPQGLVYGERVKHRACVVAFHQGKGTSGEKPTGVFVGDTGITLFNVRTPLYHSFHVFLGGFEQQTARTRGAGNGNAQLGFHTFRHGDIVIYERKTEGDDECAAIVDAAVYAVCMQQDKSGRRAHTRTRTRTRARTRTRMRAGAHISCAPRTRARRGRSPPHPTPITH